MKNRSHRAGRRVCGRLSLLGLWPVVDAAGDADNRTMTSAGRPAPGTGTLPLAPSTLIRCRHGESEYNRKTVEQFKLKDTFILCHPAKQGLANFSYLPGSSCSTMKRLQIKEQITDQKEKRKICCRYLISEYHVGAFHLSKNV